MDTLDEERRTESWLVLRAQAGDREALDALFRTIQEPLFRYVRGMVGEIDLARDILQEVLLRVYRKLPWLREPALFRAWTYRIATREVFRHTRVKDAREKKIVDGVVLDDLAAPQRFDADPELIASLPELIDGLSPASRAVIVLFYLHELSLAQVGEILEIPVGTVKSRLAYGLEVLRRRAPPAGDVPGRGAR